MITDRIFIFGVTCSGKTTLAKKLSVKLSTPFYTTDDMIYKKFDWDAKYSEKTRNDKVKQIAKKKKWIIEGTHRDNWLLPAFKKSTFVIIIDLPRHKLYRRVVKRQIKQLIKKEKGQRKVKLKDMFLLLKYATIFKKKNFIIYNELVKKHKKDFVILHSQKEINKFEEKIK